MADNRNTMTDPGIEGLLSRAGSKFSLVTVGATRAREINRYYTQLGDALGMVVPPQVTSQARKPLSIAFEEIAADKIEGVGGATGKEIPEALLPKEEPEEGSEGLDESSEAED